jgi:RND superfamily putative drug exporter
MVTKRPAGPAGPPPARSLLLGGLAIVTLLALAAPMLSPHLPDAGIRDLPDKVPVVRSLLDIQRAFPGGPGPAEVVVTHGAIREPITTALFGTPGNEVLIVSGPLTESR